MLSTRLQRFFFPAVGAIYFVGGAAALVNATFAWHSGTTGSPLFYLFFSAMYLSLSYLCFTHEWWLLPLAGLTLLSNIGMWGYRLYAVHTVPVWMGAVVLVLNALVLWFLFSVRARLADTPTGRFAAAVTLLAGAAAFYMVIKYYL